MTIAIKNFKGANASYTVAATTTSSNTVISQPSTTSGSGYGSMGYSDLKIYNASTGIAFVSYGMSAATATTSSPDFIAPGAVEIISMGIPATNVSVVLSSGAGNVYLCVGEGN